MEPNNLTVEFNDGSAAWCELTDEQADKVFRLIESMKVLVNFKEG